MREEQRVGIEYLQAVTALLQRRRITHPTYGLYEAAEMHWWWSVPRPTDDLGQLFWFDDEGRPEAAVTMNDFNIRSSALYDEITMCPLFMPHLGPDQIADCISRGVAVAHSYGFMAVELEVERSDDVMHSVLENLGFTTKESDALVEAWLSVDNRAPISELHDGYRLTSRADIRSESPERLHHMSERNPVFAEARLRETSLYRPEFDLVVLDEDDNYAGYGLFWYDPVTSTGVVEPMRTKDDHQRKGLARHILTSGVDMLAKAGAQRISIGYEPANPASGHLYRSVGFEDTKHTDVLSGPTNVGVS